MNEPNLNQVRAIRFRSGPALIVAGPGSGKTFTVTKRILYLVEEYHVPPEEILVITFTKSAAIEMKSRFHELCGEAFYPVTFGTFHAVFYQIVQTSSPTRGTLISDYDKKKILDGIIKAERFTVCNTQELLQEFSFYKRMVDKTGFHSKLVENAVFQRLYLLYSEEMETRGLIDFDDMIVKCYELLRDRRDVRKYWQKRFRYFLVDEFQDISPLQYEVLSLLCGEEKNLFAVGDDDQSIYAFRGAGPENMFRFMEDYEGAECLKLNINYRCPKRVVELADSFIRRNQKRISKELCSGKTEEGEVLLISCVSAREKYNGVCREIKRIHESGTPFSEIALLFRTNEISPVLMKELRRQGIPFQIKEKVKRLTEHFIAKDIMAYMELAMGKRTRKNLYLVMNRPNRYIPRSILDKETFTFSELKRKAMGKRYLWENLAELERSLERLSHMDSLQALSFLRKGMGYEEFLKESAYENGVAFSEYKEVLEEITELAREYGDKEEWLEVMSEAERIPIGNDEEDGVRIATIHSAKGLEWDAVMIPDCDEGMIPHKRARTKEEMEEERRLFYVAMTRAKERLLIFTYKEGREALKRPSPFIRELRFPERRH